MQGQQRNSVHRDSLPTNHFLMRHLLLLLCCLAQLAFAQAPSSPDILKNDIHVEFQTTMGNFRVRLFRDTPIHTQHFAQLVREGYYDGLLFHRVIRNFMIQAGDSTSRHALPGQSLGESDRNYTLAPEFRTPKHYHFRGALAAARESDDVNPQRRSSATQFYVVWGKRWTPNDLANVREHVDAETGENDVITDNMALDYYTRGGSPHLDGQYTVFGEVLEGLEVIGKIQGVATDRNDRPRVDVRIISARIVPAPEQQSSVR